MKTLRKGILPLALATALALAPAAAGQEPEAEVVPPENSAVTQYTEPFPTAGGNRNAHEHEGRDASPDKVLGSRNANRLEREGNAGRAVAELAADTAPAPAVPVAGEDEGETAAAGGAGKGGSDGGSGSAAKAAGSAPSDPRPAAVELAAADGSSGLGSVLARAFGGSPSGGAGFLLPLLILATILWAAAYLSRQRQTAA